MLLETESGIWARADATVFRLLMDHDRTGRRLQAANRTIANAHRRVAALRRRTEAANAREYAKAARDVDREFAVSWGRTVRVRVPRQSATVERKAKRTGVNIARASPASSTSRRAIRACKAPLRDSRGRVALYFRIRYVGFKSKNWRPGLAADHALYILRETAVEIGENGQDRVFLSNMGRDAGEIAACWNALEAMEEGYGANAKVQYRIVWNLPHDLGAEQRRELVEDFCERTFGRLGLPWVAAVHAPDARGDQRNYHAHICFSTRPCERTGDHEWQIAQEKVNGLTDAAGLKLMRALAAGHMNTACRAADLSVRFTHQTYQDRGIDAERQAHVGPAAMAAHERGEAVAVIARNAQIVERNELAAARDAVAREAALSGRLVATMAAGVNVVAERRRIGVTLAAVKRIAANARRMTVLDRPAPVPASRLEIARDIATGARTIARRPASRPTPSSATSAKAPLFSLGATARRIVTDRGDADRRRAALDQVGERLGRVQRDVALTAEKRRQAACARLHDAQVRPYRVEGSRAVLDLSAMSRNDAALVRTLDRDTMAAALRERIRHDREQDAAEALARRQADDAQRAAYDRHRHAVDEACRIVRDAPARPYRRDGAVMRTDLSLMDEADRAAILAAGLTEVSVQAAFRNRVRRDHIADMHDLGKTQTLALGNALSPSGQRQILILAASQREALTAGWADTGRLHASPTGHDAGIELGRRSPASPTSRRQFPPDRDQGR